jgi:L-fucose isomerase-like protein
MNKNVTCNLAVLSVGEEMYPQDILKAVISDVWRNVESLGENVVVEAVIMNGSDAEKVREEMAGKDIDLIILNYVSWHITPYVMSVLRDFRRVPVLVWGIGGKVIAGKLHSPAAAAGITAVIPLLRQMGYSYKIICEKPDEPRKMGEVKSYVNIVKAAKKVRHSRIGLIGYADMGLYTCSYDRTLVFDKLGVDIEDYSGYEITGRMDACPAETAHKIMDDIRSSMKCENEICDSVLEKAARLYYAMREQSSRRNLDAISIKCVNGVTGYMGFNPCLAQSMLASKDLSVICECDAYGLITSVMLSALTGQASTFMENYEVFDDSVLVGVCGYVPKDFADGCPCIRSANLGETNKGISNVSRVKEGLITFARLYADGNGSFRMFLSRGEAKKSPKWTELGWAEPTPDFPSVLLKLEIPVQKYLENVPGQHIIISYGDWTNELRQMCGLMGIAVDE